MATEIDKTPTHTYVDLVGVYTQDFKQVFPGARPVKAYVKPNSRNMEHPAENGIILTDHRIILPTEIEISLILQSVDYKQAYKTILQYFMNATLFIIQTKASTYNNFVIVSLPHEEDPDQFDALNMTIRFKQIQFVGAKFSIVPKAPTNETTVDRGTVDGTFQYTPVSPQTTDYFKNHPEQLP